MLGPDCILDPAIQFAYVGLGPGQEFIPQFLALLGLAGTALLAVLQWPIRVLLSRFSRAKRKDVATDSQSAANAQEQTAEPQP